MVHDAADVPAGPASLDAVQVKFDEQRLISDAGLMLTATLAQRLGIEELVNESVWLDPKAPGAALPGRKVMSLVHGMLAGADSIDDMNMLRAGSTGLILGHRVMAPSTLGTFLRAFSFGHVRQLDRVLDRAICRSWQAGAGPGEGPLVIDIDSFVGEVHGYKKQGASYGYTKKLGYHPLLTKLIPEPAGVTPQKPMPEFDESRRIRDWAAAPCPSPHSQPTPRVLATHHRSEKA